jgi:hypothetical protein
MLKRNLFLSGFPLCTPELSVVQAFDFRVLWEPESGRASRFEKRSLQKEVLETYSPELANAESRNPKL